MADYDIRCEVVEVINDEFDCAQVGETFIIGKRTPAGMCARAFATIYPAALAMRFSEKMAWEHADGYLDVTCPDRAVVFRISRIPAYVGSGSQREPQT